MATDHPQATAHPAEGPALNFAERLRFVRRERGIAAIELSRRIRRSDSYVSHIENGRRGRNRVPDSATLHELAAALGVAVELLTSRELPCEADGGGSRASGVRPAAVGRGTEGLPAVGGTVRPPTFGSGRWRQRGVPVINYAELSWRDHPIEPDIQVPRALFHRAAERPGACYVVDDAMRPSGIVAGDYVLLDTARVHNEALVDDEIVIVRYRDTTMVRHWSRRPDARIDLRAALPSVDTIAILPGDSDTYILLGTYCGLVSTGPRSSPSSRGW